MSADAPRAERRRAGLSIYGQLLLISFGFGAGFLLVKTAVETIPPFLLSAGRGFGAASALAVGLHVGRKRRPAPTPASWTPGVVMGTLHGWLPNVLTAWALTRIDSSLAAVLGATTPIIVAVLAHAVLTHEKLNRQQAFGVLVGIVGVALIVGLDAGALEGQDLLGQLAMLGVATSYAVGNVYGRRLSPRQPARLALRMQLVSGSIALLFALLLESPWTVRPALVAVLSLAALAVFSGAIPFWMLVRLFSKTRAVVVSTIGYLVPLVAVALGFVVLDERLGTAALIGAVFVLLGVLWAGRGAPEAEAGAAAGVPGPLQ